MIAPVRARPRNWIAAMIAMTSRPRENSRFAIQARSVPMLLSPIPTETSSICEGSPFAAIMNMKIGVAKRLRIASTERAISAIPSFLARGALDASP